MEWLLLIPALVLVFAWRGKIKFHQLRHNCACYVAVVKEYRKEKVPIEGDYSTMLYPYVQVEGFNGPLVKLRYASSISKPFEIEQRIEVFFHEGELLFWNAFDTGWRKHIPSKWDFWKSEKLTN